VISMEAQDDCKDHARHTHDEKSHAPAKRLGNHPAEHKAQQYANIDAGGVKRECGATVFRTEVVTDHRVRRRTPASLAQAHAKARQQQLSVVCRQTRQSGHATPYRQSHTDDIAAITTVSPIGNRNACRGVDQGESEAAEQPQLGITKPHVSLDRLLEYDQYLPVDKIEGIDEGQHHQHKALITSGVIPVLGTRQVVQFVGSLFLLTRTLQAQGKVLTLPYPTTD